MHISKLEYAIVFKCRSWSHIMRESKKRTKKSF